MKIKNVIFLIIVSITFFSCDVFQTVKDIQKLEFRLKNVNSFTVSGILVENKQRLEDFNATDLLKVADNVRRGRLPVSFKINVEAKNPGEPVEGQAESSVAVKSFPWTLLINGKETISGNISNPVTVPRSGVTKIFGFEAELDLVNFFGGKGYKDLLDLALNIGGQNSSPTMLEIKTKPVLSTPWGDWQYPDTLTIVHREFN